MYNRIDSLAHMYIGRYIELDADQSHSLRSDLESLKEWHREDALADYLEVLAALESDLQHGISPDTLTRWRAHIQKAWVDVRDRAMPTVIEIAASLTPEQVQELAENMEERNEDREKQFQRRDNEEYIEEIYEEFEERLSYWLGRLSSEQKQRLQAAAGQYERLDKAWLENRRAWQRQVINELGRQPGWEQRLTRLLTDGVTYTNESHIKAGQNNDQVVNAAVADVLNMRTDKQNEKLIKKINEWKQNLREFQAAVDTS